MATGNHYIPEENTPGRQAFARQYLIDHLGKEDEAVAGIEGATESLGLKTSVSVGTGTMSAINRNSEIAKEISTYGTKCWGTLWADATQSRRPLGAGVKGFGQATIIQATAGFLKEWGKIFIMRI